MSWHRISARVRAFVRMWCDRCDRERRHHRRHRRRCRREESHELAMEIETETEKKLMIAQLLPELRSSLVSHTSPILGSHCHVSCLGFMIDSAGEDSSHSKWKFVECRERLTEMKFIMTLWHTLIEKVSSQTVHGVSGSSKLSGKHKTFSTHPRPPSYLILVFRKLIFFALLPLWWGWGRRTHEWTKREKEIISA